MNYKDFDRQKFHEIKVNMEGARKDLDAVWKKIKDAYLPENLYARFLTNLNIDSTSGQVGIDRILESPEMAQEGLLTSKEPIVAIKVHTALSLLTQRTPDVVWDADTEDYEALTPIIMGLREDEWTDIETRLQYVMLWFHDIMFGTTHWRRHYLKETRDVFLPDEIDLQTGNVTYSKETVTDFEGTRGEALSPEQVWLDPAARVNAPSSHRQVMYEKIMDEDTFDRRFKDILSKKERKQLKPAPAKGYQGDNYYTLRFYENKDHDLYYVEANDTTVLKDHLPYNHKQLSVLSAIWMPRDERSPYGLGPIEMMLDNKYKLDKLEGMTLSQVKYSIFKSFFYSGHIEGGDEGGDLSLRPDRAYKASNPGDIKVVESKGPGDDAWRAIERQRERIDDITGINRPLGGEIVKTTAFQTDLAKDAALARLSTPISHMVLLLTQDAEHMLELQKQYYSLPDVRELIDEEELDRAISQMDESRRKGTPLPFDLWFEESDEDVKIFQGDYRIARIGIQAQGEFDVTRKRDLVVLRPETFDYRGKAHLKADSLLTITPTIERSRKLEVYNMLIPLFSQPPDLVAKPAKALAKLYGIDIEELFPDSWLAFLRGEEPQAPGQAPGQPQVTQEGGPMAFENPGANTVVSNVGGQKDLISAQSEQISP